ncbi:VWA domain-containing protein [Lipingzhangella sp. LS1_29]|uniref:VWA domain-containing protein n=1 Tax=Lipingzhangella rawalii TaxID=2055835 RepID=A0ABU2H1H2_9ACTN|nr:VWA domain-containing protein [Lipingzhangella rawalii]MDS1269151.1 VWA domain-containing protein [Lipingzhangella rawalii]
MSFLAAGWLWLLVLPAALTAAYVLLQGRRRRYAAQFTNLSLLEQVAPHRPGWRRHLTAALFGLTCITLILGLARPVMDVDVPRERATIMIAIDVSPSMAAADVPPDRFTAAQDAATHFVNTLPDRFNVGLVAFSATATVVASPTQDHQAIIDSVDGLRMSPGTAIGEAVFASLQSIDSFDAETTTNPDDAPPAAIVLLSDGENNSGRPVPLAADAAHTADVPVSTIAFGTGASLIELDGQLVEADIDKDELRGLAADTGGNFYEAESEIELEEVYDDVGSALGSETVRQEIVTRFVAAALVLALATAVASLAWFSRLP